MDKDLLNPDKTTDDKGTILFKSTWLTNEFICIIYRRWDGAKVGTSLKNPSHYDDS